MHWPAVEHARMNTFKQIGAVTSIGLSTLPQRLGSSFVIVIGIAGVVGVLLSVLAMATGFQKTLSSTGKDDRALVLRGGSNSELASTISRENTLTILDAPGVRRNAEGKPIGSAEAIVIVDLPKKSNDASSNVSMRGVGPFGLQARPEIHLVQGRMFSPGLREIIVGLAAQRQFKGLELGQKLELRGSEWTIVGAFESGGDSHESELIADAESVLSAYRRNLFQSVFVQLDSVAAFDGFKKALTSDPQLSVDVKREREYYADQSQGLSKVLSFVAYVVGGIMAVGALFGALNTMYSAVSTRSQEIATLRAIGFGNFPVVVSVMVEALALSLVGALIGSALSWIFFNGNAISTLGANFTQVVFKLTVTPELIVLGIIWACVIGVIGGLFPAVRAARLPVAAALRAS
jgi:putative ABC transport system permease protein